MLSRRPRRVLSLVPAAAALAATTACGSIAVTPLSPASADNDPAYSNAGNGLPAAPGLEEPAAASGAADRVLAAFQSVHVNGPYIVNGKSFTVYRFDKDTAKPPKSNCEGDCAKTWPPVLATERTMVADLDANLVGTVTRTDGSKQVTYAGWPLYTFTGDKAPTRANGQGKGGTWWAITPTGGKVAGTATNNAGVGIPGTQPAEAPAAGDQPTSEAPASGATGNGY